jgi:hypothetical protein
MFRTASFLALVLASGVVVADARVIEWAPDTVGLEFDRGKGVVWDIRENVSISMSFEPSDRKTGELTIFIRNRSEAPFTVYADKLTIKTDGGQVLRVWTKEDLVKFVKKMQFWATVANGVAAAADGYSAGQSGYRTERGDYSALVDGRRVSGSYTATVRDDAAAEEARDRAAYRASERQEQTEMSADALLRDIEQRAWSNQTLYPSDSFMASAVFDVPKKKRNVSIPITIELDVDGETFRRFAVIDP